MGVLIPLCGPVLLVPRLPDRCQILVSGRRVKGLPGAKRRDATAGSTLEAVAASWTIGSEEDARPRCTDSVAMSWADLKPARTARRARAGRALLSAEPGDGAASGAAGAALDLRTAQFGSAGRHAETTPRPSGLEEGLEPNLLISEQSKGPRGRRGP